MTILALIAPLAILALLALAALRWGVDSRIDTSDARAPHQPVGLSLR